MSKERNIGCKLTDPDLFRAMTVCIEFLDSKQIEFKLEERRKDSTFLYFLEVGHLTGFIGRQLHTNKLVYMIIDAGRLNWAEKEGFTREEAFDLVGVFREATSIASFTSWIIGEKTYKLRGPYINAERVVTENRKLT